MNLPAQKNFGNEHVFGPGLQTIRRITHIYRNVGAVRAVLIDATPVLTLTIPTSKPSYPFEVNAVRRHYKHMCLASVPSAYFVRSTAGSITLLNEGDADKDMASVVTFHDKAVV